MTPVTSDPNTVPDQPELPISRQPHKPSQPSFAMATMRPEMAVLLCGMALCGLFGMHPTSLKIGCVLIAAGIGGIAGWLPFNWRPTPIPLGWRDAPNSARRRMKRTAQAFCLPTVVLLVGWRMTRPDRSIPTETVLPIFYLSAVFTLISSALQSLRRPLDSWAPRWLSAATAAGLVAGLARRVEPGSLSIEAADGRLFGIAVWILGCADLILLSAFVGRQPGPRNSTAARARTILLLDLAGFPPLPGFWLRLNLLLALITQQRTSNISGEFEAHSGMLLLAALFALAWGMGAASLAAEALSGREQHDSQSDDAVST